MAYFSKFGTAEFRFANRTWVLEDLTKHVSNFPKYFFNSTPLDEYTIPIGDRPDNVAQTFYSDVNLWWVFFIMNNITQNDWPLDSGELEEWLNLTYTENELHTIVRYEKDTGEVVPPFGWYTFNGGGKDILYAFGRGNNFTAASPTCLFSRSKYNPITLRQSLEDENESRRNIKIVKPSRISQFLRDFEDRLAGRVFQDYR